MRYKRWPRTHYEPTPRKSAAIARRQRREREALPLFADEIAQTQPDIATVHGQRTAAWSQHDQRDRYRRAKKWREARTALARYPTPVRTQLLRCWNLHRWFPGDPVYLLAMLHMHDTGRLDLDAPNVLRTPEHAA